MTSNPENQVLNPNCWAVTDSQTYFWEDLRKSSVPAGWRNSLWREIKPAACRFPSQVLQIDPINFTATYMFPCAGQSSCCEQSFTCLCNLAIWGHKRKMSWLLKCTTAVQCQSPRWNLLEVVILYKLLEFLYVANWQQILLDMWKGHQVI